MQRVTAINQQLMNEQAEQNRALNKAARRLLQRLLGCWQHDLSRPFTHRGRTYRVCLKCGMSRDFNLSTWRSQGHFYRRPVNTQNTQPVNTQNTQTVGSILAQHEQPRMRLVS